MRNVIKQKKIFYVKVFGKTRTILAFDKFKDFL